LARLRSGREDDLRVADLAAAARRETDHRAAADPDAYMRSLGLVVTLAVDPTDLIPRLHELSVKTNQFNTTLLRLSEGDLARRIADPCSRVVAASLADRLSDSGNVLSLVVRRDQNALVVEELAMSCRALGRGIETPLILIALRRLIAELGGDHVVFPFVVGPRNDPARRWLTGLPGARLGDDVATMAWDRTAVDELIAGAPLTVTWAEAA
jgi:FkbH-like protein